MSFEVSGAPRGVTTGNAVGLYKGNMQGSGFRVQG